MNENKQFCIMDEKFNSLRKVVFEDLRNAFRTAASNEHHSALGSDTMDEATENEMIADIYRELAMIIDQHINKTFMYKFGVTIRDLVSNPNFDGNCEIKIRMIDEGRVTDVYDSYRSYGNITPYLDEVISYITISDDDHLVIEFEKNK